MVYGPFDTTVTNLRTGEVLEYSLPPERAVVCAAYQECGNYNTWSYDFTRARLTPTGRFVVCGHHAARMQ